MSEQGHEWMKLPPTKLIVDHFPTRFDVVCQICGHKVEYHSIPGWIWYRLRKALTP